MKNLRRLSLRKKLALELFSRFRSNESKLHKLRYIMWEATLKCNLSCIHCGSDCKKDSSVKDMPQEDFLKAIDQVKSIVVPATTMIVITGGEALLRKDLEQTGLQLYRRGFPWGIVTNGMLLNGARLKSLMNAGMRAITVSLDGLRDSHNWLRNHKSSFDKAIMAIEMLKDIPDLRYDVVSCINRRNINELPELKELLINRGVKEWRIFTIFPVGRAALNDEMLLTKEEFQGLLDFIKETRQGKQIKLNYGCEGFFGAYEGEVRDNLFFCKAGINIGSILADGSISACPSIRDNFIQGNIYSDNFATVWQTKYQIFRDRQWTKSGVCASCKFFKYCNGNGMHLRNGNDGQLLFCHLNRLTE